MHRDPPVLPRFSAAGEFGDGLGHYWTVRESGGGSRVAWGLAGARECVSLFPPYTPTLFRKISKDVGDRAIELHYQAGRFTDAVIQRIREIPEVAYVEQDSIVHTFGTQRFVPWVHFSIAILSCDLQLMSFSGYCAG